MIIMHWSQVHTRTHTHTHTSINSIINKKDMVIYCLIINELEKWHQIFINYILKTKKKRKILIIFHIERRLLHSVFYLPDFWRNSNPISWSRHWPIFPFWWNNSLEADLSSLCRNRNWNGDDLVHIELLLHNCSCMGNSLFVQFV